MLVSMPERHLKAAQTHDDMALRHEQAAALRWDAYGRSLGVCRIGAP